MTHFEFFEEFARAEVAAGGPDPQFKLLFAIDEITDDHEKVWLAGCYGAHHCVPSAYAIWSTWRPEVVLARPTAFRDWLEEHWEALPVRPEMRSHRMLDKRWECLWNFAEYAVSGKWRTGNYDEVWHDSIESVKYYSRYMALKFLEMLRMTVRPDLKLRDLRAKNAWSPRITLGLIFPSIAPLVADRDNNSREAVNAADFATGHLRRLLNDRGLEVSYFQTQVLLCEYHEMLAGGFYPGAGHDEEMDYIVRSQAAFDCTRIWSAREHVFDRRYLGEHGEPLWTGIRKEKFAEWKTRGAQIR